MNVLKHTRTIIEVAKTNIVGCIGDMQELSHNNYLEDGDATDWAQKFNVIRGKLDDCEDILDGLNERYAETCFAYGDYKEDNDG